mgnify:CR=1 FL=1
MSKFTFKKEPKNTGLYAVGHPHPDTDIKHDKKSIGTIVAPSWQSKDSKWTIRLMVKNNLNERSNCKWKWIQLKARFDEEPEARKYVQENSEALLKMNLHHLED